MAANLTTDVALSQALDSANTENTRAVIKNPELFAFLLTNFNNTVKLATGKPADMAVGLTSKALATTKLAGKAGGASGLVIGTTAAQMLVQTAGLVTVVGKTPAGAMIAIGAAFAKKTSLALGLAGSDDKRAKCLAALTDLAASGLTTAGLVIATPTVVGSVLLVGSAAQLMLSGYQTYQACIAPR